MRRGMRMIALSALGALAIPVPSQAVQVEVAADLVKEVVVTARVRHLTSGKTGMFTLTLREAQGVSVVKPPIGEQLDRVALNPHIGEGLPSAGLPHYSGCMTLRIVGVVNQPNRCHIYGSAASIEAEPALTRVGVAATMGAVNDWKTNVTLDLLASDTTPAQDDRAQTAEVRPTTKAGGGYLVDVAQGIKREAIIRGGIIFDETPGVGTIVFVRNTEDVTLHQYLAAHSELDRQPVVCGGGDSKGIAIGAGGEGGVYPDLNDDGEPEYIAVPEGCHPDQELEGLPVDLP